MKDIDRLFKNARRLDPPSSLKKGVMERIAIEKQTAKRAVEDKKRSRFPLINEFARRKNVWRAALAMAAMLIIVLRFGAKPPEMTQSVKIVTDIEDLNSFIFETIGPVYSAEDRTMDTSAGGSDDITTYFTNEIETLYWIDGGNENV